MKQKIKKAAVLKGTGDLCANNGTGVFSRVFKRVYRSACKTSGGKVKTECRQETLDVL